MKKLLLVLCIAFAGNIYGQIFNEDIKNTTFDLFEDLVFLNSEVLSKGDCNNAYRLNDIAMRVEIIMVLMANVNDLIAVKAGTVSILNSSQANKVERETYIFLDRTYAMRIDNLIMRSNSLIKVINHHMTPLLGSGQVIANDLRKHLREIKRLAEKYKDY